MKLNRILVVASTFPANDNDPVPAFVRDQVIAFKKLRPALQIDVLAPHDQRSNTKSITTHPEFTEYRFHYAWPYYNLEKVAGRGIMPALKANPLNYLLLPFLFLGEFIALLRLVKKVKPDVIYAHWFTPQAVISSWVGSITKTPFVFTTHAADVAVWHKIPLIGKPIVQSNTRKARAFTAVSRRSMAKLERFFTQEEWSKLQNNSAIIPMGVGITPASDAKSGSGQNILFVGRLVEKKGVHFLLPAYAQILKQFPGSKLTVAGDGPMLEELQKQAADLGISSHVSFPGYITGEAKSQYIASSDIYVVPSIITSSGDAEGLPVSLMEGLANGKLCIATNESGADDILHDGTDGFLVPEKDVEALATALTNALLLQPSATTAMRVQAQATAAQFAWPRIAQAHLDFFESNLK